MTVNIHLLQPADQGDAIAWWAAAYEDNIAMIASAFHSDSRRFERSFVASGADGILRAAASYWVRLLRDASGAPRRVAHLWGVGTPGDAADAERQQYVDQLVELALNAAQRERCELALCYPTPETHAHYGQRGWQLFPNSYRQGMPAGAQLPTTASYALRPYDPAQEPGGWERLAAVYQIYNAARPASVVRDAAHWSDYLSWRWGEWSARGSSIYLVATPPDDPARLCGYIIPKFYPDALLVAEIGVRPSDTAALPMLLAAVLEEAARRGIVGGLRVYLPSEPLIDAALDRLFQSRIQAGSYGAHAALALAPSITPADLAAMFAAPGSQAWLLDQF